jgi:hypothetical protein
MLLLIAAIIRFVGHVSSDVTKQICQQGVLQLALKIPS